MWTEANRRTEASPGRGYGVEPGPNRSASEREAPPRETSSPTSAVTSAEFGHRFAEIALLDDDDQDQGADQQQQGAQAQGGGAPDHGAAPDHADPTKKKKKKKDDPAGQQVVGPPDQEPEEAHPHSPRALLERLGEGSPLPGGVASRFEGAFGEALADVRVHESTSLASELNARAFAVGNHIGFAPGQFNPGTLEGDALLAHELAHVIQQRGAAPEVHAKGGEGALAPVAALERDADEAAVGVLERLYGGVSRAMERVRPALRSGLGLRRCDGDTPPTTIQLTVSNPTVKLNETTTLTATPQGTPPTAQQSAQAQLKFEIRRASGGSWATLQDGQATSHSYEAKAAGRFKVRAKAQAGDQRAQSEEKDLEVKFPTYADIVGDAGVAGHTDQAWANTKAATTQTGRREEGFYIVYNSTTKAYEFGPTVLGPVVGPTEGASMVPGAKPADNPASPVPPNGAKYTVAHCHTHTPTTYRTVGRAVGPSGADVSFGNGQNIVGIAYDYTDAGGGNIPAGHPINSPAQRYHFGPNQRSTP